MGRLTRIPYAKAVRRGRRQDRIVYAGLISLLIVIVVLLAGRFIAKGGETSLVFYGCSRRLDQFVGIETRGVGKI